MDNQELPEDINKLKSFEFPEYESIYFEDEDVITGSSPCQAEATNSCTVH